MSVEYVEKVYNRYSSFYDLLFGRVFQSGRDMAPELLSLAPGSQLLEVGVGTGLSFNTLPRNIEITAVDLSQKMLDQAQNRVFKMGNRPRPTHQDGRHQMEFRDNSFDRVLAAYFISTVPDPVKVVLEMKRVCRAGGHLVFLNHFLNENSFIGAAEKLLSPFFYRIGFRTDLDLHRLMRECDLEIDYLEKIDFLGHWKAVRCINP